MGKWDKTKKTTPQIMLSVLDMILCFTDKTFFYATIEMEFLIFLSTGPILNIIQIKLKATPF